MDIKVTFLPSQALNPPTFIGGIGHVAGYELGGKRLPVDQPRWHAVLRIFLGLPRDATQLGRVSHKL